jgi:hypothetical protein
MAQSDPRLSGEDVPVDSSLPAEARARIEAERGKAEIEFTTAYRKLKGASHKVTLKKTEALLAAYVHHVFFAFAEEALNCGWPAETVRQKAATFLTLLTDRTFFLKHPCTRLADRDTHRARFQDWALFAVRNSDSWLEFQKALVELADENSRGTAKLRGPTEQSPEAGKHGRQTAAERRAQVDAFITAVDEGTGRKITRKDIWTVADYTDPTDFQRFQRAAPRTTAGAVTRFTRVLKMAPGEFIRRLEIKKKQ